MEGTQYYLFIPGYYGSSLVERNSGDLIWASVREALLGHRTLALAIPGVEIPGALDLITKDLVETISVAGSFYSIEVYGETLKLLKSLSEKSPQCVVPVLYDWRKDPLEAVKNVDRTVKQIRRQEPDAKITLISHSLGSAIAAYYLRYGTQDYSHAKESWEGLRQFDKVVLSAAPFRGVLPMFRNMNHGLRFGLNCNFLSPLAYSSFPSSYFLLPPADHSVVLTHDFREVTLPLWDPEQWWSKGWGLFNENAGLRKKDFPALKKFVRKWLKRAHQFHQLTMAPLTRAPSQTPILYLQGTGTKTAHRGYWLKSESEKDEFLFYDWNFLRPKLLLSGVNGDLVYSDGDATVTAVSSELPSAFEEIGTHVLKTKLPHLEVLQDPSSQNEVKNFLRQ